MSEEVSPLEAWYLALRSPIGYTFTTNDPDRAKQKLYAARKSADDPQLAALMILTSPTNPGGEVWIAHRNIEENPDG